MKTKSFKADLIKKSDKDLHEVISDARETLRKKRFGTTGTKEAVAESKLKRTIARALTELGSRTK